MTAPHPSPAKRPPAKRQRTRRLGETASAGGPQSRPGEARARRAADLARHLQQRLGRASAEEVLRRCILDSFPGGIAVVSSFGAEAALTLALVARVDPATPVIFIDTGKHFPETLAYRNQLVRRLALADVRVVEPDPLDVRTLDPDGRLHARSPDQCCFLRKVVPFDRATGEFEALITGRKRYHGGERAALPVFEAVAGQVRINPLALWSQEEVARTFAATGLPNHPLTAHGYASIGCAPCTVPVAADAPVRAGRWARANKAECGIHDRRAGDKEGREGAD